MNVKPALMSISDQRNLSYRYKGDKGLKTKAIIEKATTQEVSLDS